MLNFGLVFETVLAAALCYTPYLDKGLNMYPLKYVHRSRGKRVGGYLFFHLDVVVDERCDG